MSLRFQCEIDALRQKGITMNDLTGDEIEALVEAVARVRNPFTEVNADALRNPLYDRNGVVLYPLTIGAVVWLEEYARRWWGNSPKAYFWAIVFALIHSREKGVFEEYSKSEESAYNAIKNEGLKLCVCEDELADAIDAALNFRRPDDGRRRENDEREAGVDWAQIILTLEVNSGIPAEKWIWERSADYAVRAYKQLADKIQRMGGGKPPPRAKDELDHAMNALARVRAGIIERIEAERAASQEAEGGSGE